MNITQEKLEAWLRERRDEAQEVERDENTAHRLMVAEAWNMRKKTLTHVLAYLDDKTLVSHREDYTEE